MKNLKSNLKSPQKIKNKENMKYQHEIILKQDLVLVSLHLSYL